MLQRRPALRFALLFAAGILFASWTALPASWILMLSASLLILCLALELSKKFFASSIVLQCCIIALGVLLQTLQRLDFQVRKLEPQFANEPVVLYGTVESEPARQNLKMNCVVASDSIVEPRAVERGSRRIMVLLYLKDGEGSTEVPSLGKKVRIEGILNPFPFQRNPGEFDYAKYLALSDIEGIVTVKGVHGIREAGLEDMRSLPAYVCSAQRALYRIFDSLHAPRHASFLKGIIFGYRGEIPSDVKQSFMDTGTIHILAVSGSNVAFVAFVLFSIFGFLRLSRRITGGLTIVGLVAYMLITGSSPSVIRATIMAIVILFGTMLERKADIYNSISVAALLLLIWDANNLFDVGFQLSFAAVVSIVYFYPRLELLIKRIPERFEEIKGIDAVLKLFAVSVAAQLGTAPFIAYYFGRVSIVSFLANILVVPMSGLSTFIGAAELGFSPLSHGIAQLYAAANDFLVWFLLGFVKQAASVPFAYIETWNVSPAAAIAYYVVVLGVFNLRRPHILAWMTILLLALGNGLLYTEIWSAAHPRLIATAVDVGQGDAILLEFPNARRILIDAGPSSQRFNAGEQTVVPFLKRKGITKLDCLVITHPHSDHIGGAGAVLRSTKVDTVFVTSQSVADGLTRHVLELARMNGVQVKTLGRGNQIQIDSGARLYVLSPDLDKAKMDNWNNTSLVLKVVYGESSILLVGDAEFPVEQTMIARYGRFLACDALKAGHHGSASSTGEDFINTVRPRTAVISVGTHNAFGHPSPRTLKMLARHSIEVLRTDKSGAIVLESDGRRWERREWRW
jgi:competence protein ComEC